MASTSPVSDVSAQTQANGSAESNGASDAKEYTLDSLKEHNSRDSLWMLLDGKVYDVTSFMDEHPGGDEVLLEEAGRDATDAFEDVGHSDEARRMLPKMLLGEFKGPKSDKAAKRAAAAAVKTTGAKSSSSNLSWLVPVALVGAYLAWRLFLA